MVVPDLPHGYETISPSDNTPRLTIKHDVTADLDSTNVFEGPEKLLEVWFAPSAKSLPPGANENGLKAVKPSTWESMLDLVNCQVLSIIKSDQVDAYLLSESSMFVWPHKIILKTCGTTTLLLGLHRLMRIAASDSGFPFHNAKSLDDIHAAATPYRVFYSRKNFLFPDKQRGPHRSWKQEVTFLDEMFESGSAYMVGKMNGDHWYLYMTSPNCTLTPPRTPDSQGNIRLSRAFKIPTGGVSHFFSANEDVPDETLEILMTDLEAKTAKQFYLSHARALAEKQAHVQPRETQVVARESLGDISGHGVSKIDSPDISAVIPESAESGHIRAVGLAAEPILSEPLLTEGHALGTVVTDSCGLSNVYPTSIYPDARIDAYLFSPCGFSANGVIPAPPPSDDKSGLGAHYFTVHVTPEPHCSYASFETNVPSGQKGLETVDVICQVVSIFRPGRFSVTLFEAKSNMSSPYDQDGGLKGRNLGSSRRQRPMTIDGYRRIDRIVYDFEDYDLVFWYYEREGWVDDGAARVGEDI